MQKSILLYKKEKGNMVLVIYFTIPLKFWFRILKLVLFLKSQFKRKFSFETAPSYLLYPAGNVIIFVNIFHDTCIDFKNASYCGTNSLITTKKNLTFNRWFSCIAVCVLERILYDLLTKVYCIWKIHFCYFLSNIPVKTSILFSIIL